MIKHQPSWQPCDAQSRQAGIKHSLQIIHHDPGSWYELWNDVTDQELPTEHFSKPHVAPTALKMD
ncbi:hypothetical protein ACLEJW_05270 [Pseudomonas sp. SMSB3]|uniref:hypothetical protein n=1 Tax=Pseudomonas sp. SMSB3 TaxID=3390196 RepID=UPI003F827147